MSFPDLLMQLKYIMFKCCEATDNPLIDSNVIKDVVDYHLENNFDTLQILLKD